MGGVKYAIISLIVSAFVVKFKMYFLITLIWVKFNIKIFFAIIQNKHGKIEMCHVERAKFCTLYNKKKTAKN